MFREKFQSKVKKLNLKRGEDEPGILTEMTLQGEITDSQLVDLGSEVLAMVEARSAGDTRVLPFKTAELDQDYSDLSLYVYATPGMDPEPRGKFQTEGVSVNKIKLVKSEEQPTRPDLQMCVKIPPLKADDLIWLIQQLGHSISLKLTSSQTELPLDGDDDD